MKFNYKFNIGQIVFYKGKALTIKRRVGNCDTPAYAVMEDIIVYFESELSEINTLSEYTPEQSDRDMKSEYKTYLQELDDRYSVLSEYSRNLNLLALKNELTPTYGRETEVDKIRTILLRRTKPNPILTGVAGCGKTAIIEELARTFVNYYLNTADKNTPIIYDLSLNSLVSGTKYRGDFEGRLNSILNLLSRNENIVIFIDEIHSINDVGIAEGGATSAGQILKPALARGDIRCIGATTTEEYKKYIATDKALARRFSVVNIVPLAGTARTNCIEKIVAEYGTYFDIKTDSISASAIENIIDNIIPETVFPDNVIDIIDETLATAKFKKKNEITISDINITVSRMTGYLII